MSHVDIRTLILREWALSVRHGRKRRWLPDQVGMRADSLERALRADHDPRLSVIEACCRVLGLSVERTDPRSAP